MIDIDPDILHVLKKIAGSGERSRVTKVKAKHDDQLWNRIETQVELLSDELERVIPRKDPLFMPVLMGAVIRKLARMDMEKEEPEYKSELDHFPPSW